MGATGGASDSLRRRGGQLAAGVSSTPDTGHDVTGAMMLKSENSVVYLKDYATVQTVRERYNKRPEKILNSFLRIFSQRLLYRSRTC